MSKFEFTAHAKDMLTERKIPEEWVWRVLNEADKEIMGEDGNKHYTKAISEHEGHILHIVVNHKVKPNRIITLFFDRRLSRTK